MLVMLLRAEARVCAAGIGEFGGRKVKYAYWIESQYTVLWLDDAMLTLLRALRSEI